MVGVPLSGSWSGGLVAYLPATSCTPVIFHCALIVNSLAQGWEEAEIGWATRPTRAPAVHPYFTSQC